jgi:hypothetical protein
VEKEIKNLTTIEDRDTDHHLLHLRHYQWMATMRKRHCIISLAMNLAIMRVMEEQIIRPQEEHCDHSQELVIIVEELLEFVDCITTDAVEITDVTFIKNIGRE